MNEELATEIRDLFQKGVKMTVIFRRMLENHHRERMGLFFDLLEIFKVSPATLSRLGGWSYWERGPDEGPGFTDEEVDEMMAGEFKLKGP